MKIGEIVMVKENDKQSGTWKIDRIDELFVRKNGFIRGVRMKTAQLF